MSSGLLKDIGEGVAILRNLGTRMTRRNIPEERYLYERRCGILKSRASSFGWLEFFREED